MLLQPNPGVDVLFDPFWLEPPDAPNARLVCATVRPSRLDAAWADVADTDVAGCDLDIGVARARCRGEAIEYLSQLHHPEAPDWLSARSLSDGEVVEVRVDDVLQMPGASQPGIGAGVAAGRTFEEAVAAALWELVERHAVTRWWYEGQAGHRLAAETEQAAQAYALALRGMARTRVTRLIDISERAGLPVMVAISTEADGTGFVAGMAGHVDPTIAAQKAIRELVQMETGLRMAQMKQQRGRDLNVHEDRMLRREARLDAAAQGLIGAPPLAHPTGADDLLAQTAATAVALDRPVLVVDLTQPRFGLPVAKVLAPGLCSIPEAAAWEAAGGGDRVALY